MPTMPRLGRWFTPHFLGRDLAFSPPLLARDQKIAHFSEKEGAGSLTSRTRGCSAALGREQHHRVSILDERPQRTKPDRFRASERRAVARLMADIGACLARIS